MEEFDNAYQNRSDLFGQKPSWGLRKFVDDHKLGNGNIALDLGCGQGRDTTFLAKCGFEVHAVDRSEPAIAAIRNIAHSDPTIKIHAEVADVSTFTPPD